jgi:hypothetical protein
MELIIAQYAYGKIALVSRRNEKNGRETPLLGLIAQNAKHPD